MINGALTSNLTSPTAFDPNRRVSLFFRAFQVSISPSLVMKVQDAIFHYKAALSTLKIYCLVLLLLSRFNHVRLCVTPEMLAHQAPPSLGFSRQEHWSGLPFPSPMHESEK